MRSIVCHAHARPPVANGCEHNKKDFPAFCVLHTRCVTCVGACVCALCVSGSAGALVHPGALDRRGVVIEWMAVQSPQPPAEVSAHSARTLAPYIPTLLIHANRHTDTTGSRRPAQCVPIAN